MDEKDYFWRLTNTPAYWQDAARDLICAANLLKRAYRALLALVSRVVVGYRATLHCGIVIRVRER